MSEKLSNHEQINSPEDFNPKEIVENIRSIASQHEEIFKVIITSDEFSEVSDSGESFLNLSHLNSLKAGSDTTSYMIFNEIGNDFTAIQYIEMLPQESHQKLLLKYTILRERTNKIFKQLIKTSKEPDLTKPMVASLKEIDKILAKIQSSKPSQEPPVEMIMV